MAGFKVAGDTLGLIATIVMVIVYRYNSYKVVVDKHKRPQHGQQITSPHVHPHSQQVAERRICSCKCGAYKYYDSACPRCEEDNGIPIAPPEVQTYKGGVVSRTLLEKALDYFISLEPVGRTTDYDEVYKRNCSANQVAYRNAEAIVRTYGEQIMPKELSSMQDVFYSIVNSEKYSSDPRSSCVVYAALNQGWRGVGEWS